MGRAANTCFTTTNLKPIGTAHTPLCGCFNSLILCSLIPSASVHHTMFRRILHLKGCLDQVVEKLELVFQQKKAANLFLKAAEKN
ncbi:unnamed protein product [Brassica oleracea var. botrytis]|uniref:BnaC02g45170D protein n=2 Tax=Brassica napus TaxID=3708 RepID=A0A078JJ98_BRANA|nr:hypothetical protein HID58_049942 [Brassica napus]CAF1922249.1 unnamed protein product [Brassica napus]CDY65891.1 BnaC02g45170D [Brassica napus]